MGLYTVEQAKQHLDAWLEADLALTTGKEYRIGTRLLQRSDASEVKERISFWSRELIKAQGSGRKKTRRVIPYD
ncbi:DUF6148 family protein [Pelosinus sp. UFO1]|uniref:DUF6148 family protein n=1 Tax=Pelosinus sp. UFO1 TaxID=484770 RepID=UPI0004D1CBA4|nr:DUF6148 family protein [Pelosinus sp. UFO1]AIF51247.1 hypothetical protein UFO1_1696 [Pelosinus sp. UFO1]